MKYLICNLKANKTYNEVINYEHELRKIPKNKTELIICPSTAYTACFRKDNYTLGAQDVSKFVGGAYTGESTAKQLASLGCEYALVGHCERRAYFKEDESVITTKIKNAFNAGLNVFYIIGETKEEYQRGKTMNVIEKQIGRVLNNFKREEIKNISIIYEPVWAVDNKQDINIIHIKEVVDFIKVLIKDYYELELPVIYGGGVKEENYKKLVDMKKLDGILLGETSLDVEKVKNIYSDIN